MEDDHCTRSLGDLKIDGLPLSSTFPSWEAHDLFIYLEVSIFSLRTKISSEKANFES